MTEWTTIVDTFLDAHMREFGEDVEYTPISTGTPVTIRGVYNAETVRWEVMNGVPVEMKRPTLGVKLADLPGGVIEKLSGVVVRSISYTIHDRDLDGEGGGTMILRLS